MGIISQDILVKQLVTTAQTSNRPFVSLIIDQLGIENADTTYAGWKLTVTGTTTDQLDWLLTHVCPFLFSIQVSFKVVTYRSIRYAEDNPRHIGAVEQAKKLLTIYPSTHTDERLLMDDLAYLLRDYTGHQAARLTGNQGHVYGSVYARIDTTERGQYVLPNESSMGGWNDDAAVLLKSYIGNR